MKRKIFASLILFLLLSVVFNKNAFSWSEATHMNLSEYAAESSVLSKDKGDYLKNLGFENRLEEYFQWGNVRNKIRDWIAVGANLEDASSFGFPVVPYSTTRSFNHFHDPLKPWYQAGLNDTWTGVSSLLWAQAGSLQKLSPDGDWSWQKVREHYYTALTGKDFTGTVVAPDKEKRDEYFARTFRGLGNQVHLIQDAGQPDHVRNDAHPEDSTIQTRPIIGGFYFETWAKRRLPTLSKLKDFAQDPLLPQVSFNVSYGGLVPITQFIDTTPYTGNNPDTTLTQGIAEYTNANFFSDDTIFAAERYSTDHRHYFPYPKRSSTDLQKYIDGTKTPETVTSRDGITDTGIWISKERDGERITHFVRPSYLTPTVYKLFGEGSLYYQTFYIDNIAHSEYAYPLLRRAVGYSAGLLNYFFRGEMDMVPDDVTGSGYVIVNNTDEDMSGTFELWYDDKDDNRKPVKSWTLNIAKKSSGNNKSTNIDFTPPTDAKEPGKYMLVFRGKLGNEEDAVVGKEVMLLPPLVFLIYQDAYAVWSILENGKELKDVTFNITQYTTYFGLTGNNPSVVKSNDDYKEHVYTIEHAVIPKLTGSYRLNVTRYGKVDPVLIGVRNCFIKNQFDSSLDYLGYGSDYICSGKHSSYRSENEGLIEDLELWKISGTSGQIKYKVGDDVRYGSTISFNDERNIHSVLSTEKIVGITGAPITESFDNRYVFKPGGRWCNTYSGEAGIWLGSFGTKTNVVQYKFGDTVLDYVGADHSKGDGKLLSVNYSETCVGAPHCVATASGQSEYERWKDSNITILDYDHIPGDTDGTFIVFYRKMGDYIHSKQIGIGYWNGDYGSTVGQSVYVDAFFGGSAKYILVYKLNGGGIVREDICSLLNGRHNSGTGYPTFESPYCEVPSDWVYNETSYNGIKGQRITGISTKVTEKYILYTYILEDYDSGVPPNETYTFNKRILGIIDIETGTRTEYEVNDTLLGQYKDTFDKALPSAIGFHNGSVKK